MKTAIEWLQAEFNKWAEGKVFIPQDLLEEAKRKEKEQICNSYVEGLAGLYMGAEEYYNQTYNQKQIIIDIMKADEEDGLYKQNK